MYSTTYREISSLVSDGVFNDHNIGRNRIAAIKFHNDVNETTYMQKTKCKIVDIIEERWLKKIIFVFDKGRGNGKDKGFFKEDFSVVTDTMMSMTSNCYGSDNTRGKEFIGVIYGTGPNINPFEVIKNKLTNSNRKKDFKNKEKIM